MQDGMKSGDLRRLQHHRIQWRAPYRAVPLQSVLLAPLFQPSLCLFCKAHTDAGYTKDRLIVKQNQKAFEQTSPAFATKGPYSFCNFAELTTAIFSRSRLLRRELSRKNCVDPSTMP